MNTITFLLFGTMLTLGRCSRTVKFIVTKTCTSKVTISAGPNYRVQQMEGSDVAIFQIPNSAWNGHFLVEFVSDGSHKSNASFNFPAPNSAQETFYTLTATSNSEELALSAAPENSDQKGRIYDHQHPSTGTCGADKNFVVIIGFDGNTNPLAPTPIPGVRMSGCDVIRKQTRITIGAPSSVSITASGNSNLQIRSSAPSLPSPVSATAPTETTTVPKTTLPSATLVTAGTKTVGPRHANIRVEGLETSGSAITDKLITSEWTRSNGIGEVVFVTTSASSIVTYDVQKATVENVSSDDGNDLTAEYNTTEPLAFKKYLFLKQVSGDSMAGCTNILLLFRAEVGSDPEILVEKFIKDGKLFYGVEVNSSVSWNYIKTDTILVRHENARFKFIGTDDNSVYEKSSAGNVLLLDLVRHVFQIPKTK